MLAEQAGGGVASSSRRYTVPGVIEADPPLASLVRGMLTTDHEGKQACARREIHGLSGVKTWCMMPPRPFIRHFDDGCSADTRRCVVSYTQPVFPPCGCDKYVGRLLAMLPALTGS